MSETIKDGRRFELLQMAGSMRGHEEVFRLWRQCVPSSAVPPVVNEAIETILNFEFPRDASRFRK